MTAREWWDASAAGGDWRHAGEFSSLSRDDQRTVERWIKAALAHEDADVRELGTRIATDIEAASWGADAPPLSRHLELELDAIDAGRTLTPGAPVPRCGCYLCTGIPADAATKARTGSRRTHDLHRGKGRPRPEKRDLRPALDVDAARAVPIMDVAARLGIEVNRAGWALCFNHADSTPSLHVNAKKNRVYCNPCSASWDAIGLVMAYRKVPFVDAVRELAA